MKTYLQFTLLLLLISMHVSADNLLSVSDPHRFGSTQGNIEEATVTVQPKGAYFEYGLYLTFSAKGTAYKSTDSLEIVLRFELPPKAIVTDSWLWIGNDIIQGKIMNAVVAKATYENIVKRRRDPSLLLKQSNYQYQLSVYPMKGNETRRVKITYLVPADHNGNYVASTLPINIISTSRYRPPLSVIVRADDDWKNPKIIQSASSNLTDSLAIADSLAFRSGYDNILKDYQYTYIPANRQNVNMRIVFDNPLKNGYYFSSFKNQESDGFYQLIFSPKNFIADNQSHKVAVIIDYDKNNTPIKDSEYLNIVKKNMLEFLNEKDSFNLFYSTTSAQKYSESWIAATPVNIQNAFNNLNLPISQSSKLSDVIKSGIEFINNNGQDGKVILISTSDVYASVTMGDKMLNDIKSWMHNNIPFYIADLQTLTFPSYWVHNMTYYGNEYLYFLLSEATEGYYHRSRDEYSVKGTLNVVSDVTKGAFNSLKGSFDSFSINPVTDSGYLMGENKITDNKSIDYLYEPYILTGRFRGDIPKQFNISGQINNEFKTGQINIDINQIKTNESANQKIWYGSYLLDLESVQQKSFIRNEIIYTSLNERILSLYTAFFCPEDTTLICKDCPDESALVAANDEIIVGEDIIEFYPNPFKDVLNIALVCSEPSRVKKLSVYNTNGSLVHQFDISGLQTGRNLLSWDTGNLQKGIYLLVYINGNSTKTIKIVRQ